MADGNEALLLLIDQVTGENPTTWGEKADTNFAMLAQAAMNAYPYSVGAATGDLTLTDTAHAANQNRRGLIRAVGTRSEAGNLILPTRQLRWFILNETAYTLTAKTSGGTGIAIPPDELRLVYCDGTNIEDTGLINQTQLTAQLAAVSAAGFTTTSTTSNAISVAGTNLSFTLAASGKAMAAGTPVRVALTSDPANHYMDMITTSYSGTAWAGTVVSATGSGTYSAWTFSVAGGPSVTMATTIRKPKTSAYVVDVTDNGALIDCTSGTFTVTLPAAASAGDGFGVVVLNSGAGTITVDGDGSETINGATTVTLAQYQSAHLIGDGSNWKVRAPGAALPASAITSGTVATARLGSGSASSATYLRGDQTWAAAGGSISDISANATLAGADSGTCKRITADCTIALTAAATLGAGWWCDVLIDGDYNDLRIVTIDPASSEEIDEQTSIKSYIGEKYRIYCDGSKFRTYGRPSDVYIGEYAIPTGDDTANLFSDGAIFDDPELASFHIHFTQLSHNDAATWWGLQLLDGSGSLLSSGYTYGSFSDYSAPAGADSASTSLIGVLSGNLNATDPFDMVVEIDVFRGGSGYTIGKIQAHEAAVVPGVWWFRHATSLGGLRISIGDGSAAIDGGSARIWAKRQRRS